MRKPFYVDGGGGTEWSDDGGTDDSGWIPEQLNEELKEHLRNEEEDAADQPFRPNRYWHPYSYYGWRGGNL